MGLSKKLIRKAIADNFDHTPGHRGEDNFTIVCKQCESPNFRYIVDLPFDRIKAIVNGINAGIATQDTLLKHIITVCATCGARNKGASTNYKVMVIKDQPGMIRKQ